MLAVFVVGKTDLKTGCGVQGEGNHVWWNPRTVEGVTECSVLDTRLISELTAFPETHLLLRLKEPSIPKEVEDLKEKI